MKKFGFIFWMWALGVPAVAQVPGITYQAVILDSKILPGEDNLTSPLVEKDICLKFLFKSATGVPEYEEVISTTTDAFGMVNVVIGTGSRIGGSANTFSQIVWNSQAKFLEVSFDKVGLCASFVFLSSQQFTAVPFALYAASSGTAGPAGPTGVQGAVGPAGPAGVTGLNAYQLAVAAGFNGTEAQWLASLQGASGASGPSGAMGITGIAGPTGPAGGMGSSAYQVAVGAGFVGTEAQWLESLMGVAGAPGPQGIQGQAGVGLFDGSEVGQMLFWNGSEWVLLDAGTQSQLLTFCENSPIWTDFGNCPGTIGNINCSNISLAGTLYRGLPVNNISLTLDYSDGGGGAYFSQAINSTGVSGLVATLIPGEFETGIGELVFSISGIPSEIGNAIFPVSIGGQSCNVSLPVINTPGLITGLNCEAIIITDSLIQNVYSIFLPGAGVRNRMNR
jgi:hypothetical protein